MEFSRGELCFTFTGAKVHIRKNVTSNYTKCGQLVSARALDEGLIGVTDRCAELCQVCLSSAKARRRCL